MLELKKLAGQCNVTMQADTPALKRKRHNADDEQSLPSQQEHKQLKKNRAPRKATKFDELVGPATIAVSISFELILSLFARGLLFMHHVKASCEGQRSLVVRMHINLGRPCRYDVCFLWVQL